MRKFGRGVTAAILGAALLAPTPGVAQQFSDSYSFLKAVRDRNGEKATELLSQPGSRIVDTKDSATGETALHIVIKRRDPTWLSFLIGKGAKLDARDDQGNTPLMAATAIGFTDAAELLIGRRANVNLANNGGETPIIRAVQNRDMAMVRLLLAAGADAKKPDAVAGLSARDYAERDGRSATILRMIDEAKPVAKKAVAGPGL